MYKMVKLGAWYPNRAHFFPLTAPKKSPFQPQNVDTMFSTAIMLEMKCGEEANFENLFQLC